MGTSKLNPTHIDLTYVEDQEGFLAVYVGDDLVCETEQGDLLDFLAAFEKQDWIKVGRLYFKDRYIEDYPERLGEVLMWQVED